MALKLVNHERGERDPEPLFNKMKYEDVEESDQNISLKCDFCDESFANEESLSAHVMTINRTIIEGQKLPPLMRSKIQCKFCEKEYTSQNSLNVHISTIHEKKGFKCYACDMTFPHNFSLYNHQQIVHKRKEFKCDFCGK